MGGVGLLPEAEPPETQPQEATMRHFSPLILITVAAPALAAPCENLPADTHTLQSSYLYVEDNAGDGDLGVHGYFDDHGWKELCIYDPAGELVLHVLPSGRMGKLGIAGVFFESLEPVYTDWSYEDLKADFPEGEYSVKGLNWDGKALAGAANFTTLVPLPPKIVRPATVPEADAGPLPAVPVADLIVEWMPVTKSRDERVPQITGYQVWINKENHEDPNGFSRPVFDLHLGPDRTMITVPAAFFDANSVYELEILAIEESGNQTIAGASYFRTE
jgi:hypothetical protein